MHAMCQALFPSFTGKSYVDFILTITNTNHFTDEETEPREVMKHPK